MKKKQIDMLKLYDLQDSNESQAQTCIYCKESNGKLDTNLKLFWNPKMFFFNQD